MKSCLTGLFFTFIFYLFGQNSDFIHTSGRSILGPCEDTLILRGVNYAPYNWGYNISDLKIDQIALTGANCVRLVWYHNNPDQNTLYTNHVALDSVLSKCVGQKLIPILELHDYTCQNNTSNLAQSVNFWTNPQIVAVLNKYKHSLIVNIANEALYVNWTGNQTTALNTYQATYQNIISNLRNVANFGFPIMIDAPDCGQTSSVFATSSTAQNLIDSDPLHNLIFSAHAYWYGYTGNDSTQMAAKINEVLNENIPFVLGEIANLQDDASMCQYNLNYQALLNHCEPQGVSWIAWSWDHDGCAERQLSTNGNFSNLTTYGNDIVYNPTYGLVNEKPKSSYLENNGCENLGLINLPEKSKVNLFPSITDGKVTIVSTETMNLNFDVFGLKGEIVFYGNVNEVKEIDFSAYENGIYFIKFRESNQQFKIIKL